MQASGPAKSLPKEQCATRDFPVFCSIKQAAGGCKFRLLAKRPKLKRIGFPNHGFARLPLHKSFLCRFRVDAAFFRAHAPDAERKDCDCRSTFSGAQCAIAMARTRHSDRDRSGGDRISWRRNVARDAILNPGRRNLLQEVPLMEDTPPESKPGFA